MSVQERSTVAATRTFKTARTNAWGNATRVRQDALIPKPSKSVGSLTKSLIAFIQPVLVRVVAFCTKAKASNHQISHCSNLHQETTKRRIVRPQFLLPTIIHSNPQQPPKIISYDFESRMIWSESHNAISIYRPSIAIPLAEVIPFGPSGNSTTRNYWSNKHTSRHRRQKRRTNPINLLLKSHQ